ITKQRFMEWLLVRKRIEGRGNRTESGGRREKDRERDGGDTRTAFALGDHSEIPMNGQYKPGEGGGQRGGRGEGISRRSSGLRRRRGASGRGGRRRRRT